MTSPKSIGCRLGVGWGQLASVGVGWGLAGMFWLHFQVSTLEPTPKNWLRAKSSPDMDSTPSITFRLGVNWWRLGINFY